MTKGRQPSCVSEAEIARRGNTQQWYPCSSVFDSRRYFYSLEPTGMISMVIVRRCQSTTWYCCSTSPAATVFRHGGMIVFSSKTMQYSSSTRLSMTLHIQHVWELRNHGNTTHEVLDTQLNTAVSTFNECPRSTEDISSLEKQGYNRRT